MGTPERLYCFVDEIQWGDTRTYDETKDRMVPTIEAGSELDIELMLSLPDLKSYGYDVYKPSDELARELSPALEGLKLGLPVYRFAGIVRDVQLLDSMKGDPNPDFRNLRWLNVDLDCGVPIWLSGQVGLGDPFLEGERWRLEKGRWLEGITTLWANVAWQESPWNWVVRVRVESMEELGPVKLHQESWCLPLLTLSLLESPRKRHGPSPAYLNE